MSEYAHTISDLIDGKREPCPFDHHIALQYTSTGTQPLSYRDWLSRVKDQGYMPCPHEYPEADR